VTGREAQARKDAMADADDVRAIVLGLPENGAKRIVLVERSGERAKDWLRQSRAMSKGGIRYRMHERMVSAEGLRTFLYVVVAFRVDR
jgi:shikimate 5-dehydrogenase